MQVYRGLPILTNQPSRPTRLVGIRALDEEMSVGRVRRARPRGDRRRSSTVAARRWSAGGTGLYLRAALADLDVPPAVDPEARARVAREVDDDSGRRASPARGARSGRGRGRPSARPQAPRPGARARRRGHVARRGPRSALGRGHAPADADRRARRRPGPPRAADSRRGRRRCSRGASSTRCARRSPGRSRARPRRRSGSRRSPSSGRDALEPIVVRTRRYAAYQRKWMRRIPGLVLVDAARAPRRSRTTSSAAHSDSLFLDAVREVARARERLPPRGAARRGGRSRRSASAGSATSTPGSAATALLEVTRPGRRGARRSRIWNPDGSTAELSGNGTRIAARLAASGERPAGGRDRRPRASASAPHRERGTAWSRQELGAVSVGRRRGARRRGRAARASSRSTSATRTPSSCATTLSRDDLLRLGPAIETHPRFPDARTCSSRHRNRGTSSPCSSGSAARGRRRRRARRRSRSRRPRSREAGARAPSRVAMPGGELVVAITGGEATLEGPAEQICARRRRDRAVGTRLRPRARTRAARRSG